MFGEENGRCPHRKGEEQVGAGGIAEVQLGHRDRDVVGAVAERLVGVAAGGVDERAMGLHHRLGHPGGAAREQPDGRVIPVAGHRLQAFGILDIDDRHLAARVWFRGDEAGSGFARLRSKGVVLRSGGHHRTRRAVGKELGGAILSELGVHHHHHRPGLENPEEGADEVEPVGKRHEYPLLGPNPDVPQSGGIAFGEEIDVFVGGLARLGPHRDAVAVALAESVGQEEISDVERRHRPSAEPAQAPATTGTCSMAAATLSSG